GVLTWLQHLQYLGDQRAVVALIALLSQLQLLVLHLFQPVHLLLFAVSQKAGHVQVTALTFLLTMRLAPLALFLTTSIALVHRLVVIESGLEHFGLSRGSVGRDYSWTAQRAISRTWWIRAQHRGVLFRES